MYCTGCQKSHKWQILIMKWKNIKQVKLQKSLLKKFIKNEFLI